MSHHTLMTLPVCAKRTDRSCAPGCNYGVTDHCLRDSMTPSLESERLHVMAAAVEDRIAALRAELDAAFVDRETVRRLLWEIRA